MPLISEWCWRRVYKISTQGKYPHMEECRLTNWIWQEIKQIPFLHLPVDAHTHKCAFFYSGSLTFSSSDKPLSAITEKKIMKKEKKNRKHSVIVCYLLYSSSEHRAFVTVILPIWTTCCKHPEGSECYQASKLWPILPLQVETGRQPFTLCLHISNGTHTHARKHTQAQEICKEVHSAQNINMRNYSAYLKKWRLEWKCLPA